MKIEKEFNNTFLQNRSSKGSIKESFLKEQSGEDFGG